MQNLMMILFFGGFWLLLVLDRVIPARLLPGVRQWRLVGLVFFVVSMAVGMAVPLMFDEWFATHRLVDATGLGVVGGALVGLLVVDLASWLWHRSLHRFSWLWRIHQLHHSAERIDVYGAYLFHPLDAAGFALVGSVSLVLIVGVQPEAAAIAIGIANILALFQHANLRTPRWLGYIVQRPESHAAHHERGVHGGNYGNLAIWDIVFGTFRNPAKAPAEAGFYDGASSRIPEMLLGLPVDVPPPAQYVEPAAALAEMR